MLWNCSKILSANCGLKACLAPIPPRIGMRNVSGHPMLPVESSSAQVVIWNRKWKRILLSPTQSILIESLNWMSSVRQYTKNLFTSFVLFFLLSSFIQSIYLFIFSSSSSSLLLLFLLLHLYVCIFIRLFYSIIVTNWLTIYHTNGTNTQIRPIHKIKT